MLIAKETVPDQVLFAYELGIFLKKMLVSTMLFETKLFVYIEKPRCVIRESVNALKINVDSTPPF